MSDYTNDNSFAVIGLDTGIMWTQSGPDYDKRQQHIQVDYN